LTRRGGTVRGKKHLRGKGTSPPKKSPPLNRYHVGGKGPQRPKVGLSSGVHAHLIPVQKGATKMQRNMIGPGIVVAHGGKEKKKKEVVG